MPKLIQCVAAIVLLAGFSNVVLGQSDAKSEMPVMGKTTALFDGSNLDHWRGYRTETIGIGWQIQEDGSLMFDGGAEKGHGGDLVTKDVYSDFVLTFKWKVSADANSGVIYRVGLGDKAPYFTGPEYQVIDDVSMKNNHNPKTAAGAIYGLYEATGKKLNAVGEWNSAKIVLKGNNVQHWLNGVKVVNAEMYSDDWNKQVAASKFSKWDKFATLKSGHIAFQDHGNQVWYRDIVIVDLGGPKSETDK